MLLSSDTLTISLKVLSETEKTNYLSDVNIAKILFCPFFSIISQLEYSGNHNNKLKIAMDLQFLRLTNH